MMAFNDWALQFVLADDDDDASRRDAASKAARAIESSSATRTTVANWTASVRQWMPGGSGPNEDDEGDRGAIARAKALEFLAQTLEHLNGHVLRSDQAQRLAAFFGSTFSCDHKAGVLASAKALRHLSGMKHFRPSVGVSVVGDVLQIKDDFLRQAPGARLEIYELLLQLFRDDAITRELRAKYGDACGFVGELLQLCQHERDPRNLMVWFDILRVLLTAHAPSTEVAESIFKAFSAYYPISLRSGTNAARVTADDLKAALRECFAAHDGLATHAVPFLLQKLDQGDAVTVSVKVDVLRTIQRCVDQYQDVASGLVPFRDTIWNSLKYEVRNGEVKETIDVALDVIRSLAHRFASVARDAADFSLLSGYLDLILADCEDDLANSTYAKQVGLLLTTAITANIEAFALRGPGLMASIQQQLRSVKAPRHTKDLLGLLNATLSARAELVTVVQYDRRDPHPLYDESSSLYDHLFEQVYLPLAPQPSSGSHTGPDQAEVVTEVFRGLAHLTSLQSIQDGKFVLACSGATCRQICILLSRYLFVRLNDLASVATMTEWQFDAAAHDALKSSVANYNMGFAEVLKIVKPGLEQFPWSSPSREAVAVLQDTLSMLADIGCSRIPRCTSLRTLQPGSDSLDTDIHDPYSAIQNLCALVDELLSRLPCSGAREQEWMSIPDAEAVASVVGGGLVNALLLFSDACIEKHGPDVAQQSQRQGQQWLDLFRPVQRTNMLTSSIDEQDSAVYHHFLRVGLYTLWTVYRRICSGDPEAYDSRVVAVAGLMAAFVVGLLDETTQRSTNLAREAFRLFRDSDNRAKTQEEDGLRLAGLTRGILEGLWPGAMTELYESGGLAERILCNAKLPPKWQPPQAEVRAIIGLVLANKSSGSKVGSDASSSVKQKTLTYWKEYLETVASSAAEIPGAIPSTSDSAEFEANVLLALHIVCGVAARQDRAILDLVPVIHSLMANKDWHGDVVARTVHVLFKYNCLDLPGNHGTFKKLCKYWTYNYFLKPLYEKALPAAKGAAAGRFSTAILTSVEHCQFAVYQDDLEALIRLLITVLGKRGATSDVVSALKVLLEILTSEPNALQSHIIAVVGTVVELYQDARDKDGSRSQTQRRLSRDTRKLAIKVLWCVPEKFEARHLRGLAPHMQRMMAVASGDSVREIRQFALGARRAWSRVT